MNIAKDIPESIGTKITAVYQLHADHSYCVKHNPLREGMYILVYTFIGEGVLNIEDKEIVLKEDHVYLFPANQAFSYRANIKQWGFWWYEFSTEKVWDMMQEPHYLPRENFIDILCEKLYDAHLKQEFEVAGKFLEAFYSYSGQVISNLEHASIKKQLLYEAQNYIKSEMHRITVTDLARKLNISTRTLYSTFIEGIEMSPKQYILLQKNEMAAYLLRSTSKTMDEIAEEVGFSNAFHLSKSFKKHYGMSPYYYKKLKYFYESKKLS